MSCTYTKKTKLSEIVGDDTNNEGVEKHKKKYWHKNTSIGFDFNEKEKKNLQNWQKKMSLTFARG